MTETTVYTSLEACAQCSGIMALASLPKVFYLQPDPGQYFVAQLMRQLSDVSVAQHVPANAFGFEYFNDLVKGYDSYLADHRKTPFYKDAKGEPRFERGVTSYLCTDNALDVYRRAALELEGFKCQHGNFAPVVSVAHRVLTNGEVLDNARFFLQYVKQAAQRGTPHFN